MYVKLGYGISNTFRLPHIGNYCVVSIGLSMFLPTELVMVCLQLNKKVIASALSVGSGTSYVSLKKDLDMMSPLIHFL